MKFSKLAREIYGRYTDQIEPYGMDECWLDVTGSGCMGTGFEIADEIRRTVKFELGLTISAGDADAVRSLKCLLRLHCVLVCPFL